MHRLIKVITVPILCGIVIASSLFISEWNSDGEDVAAISKAIVVEKTEPVITVSQEESIPIAVEETEESITEVIPEMSREDVELIALVTMAEAEGECEEGKRLVIDTVLNRVDSDYFPDTGYEVHIDDDAGLLTDDELAKLSSQMEAITEWGNVAFVTTTYNPSSADDYARNYSYSHFGQGSSTLFLIDMDNRKVYIFSNGYIYKTITKAYANTITDNIYTYATDARYYDCASKAFSQINILLSGGRISQPMKYISNALIALVLAFIINFIVIRIYSKKKAAKGREIINNIFSQCNLHNANCVMTGQTRVYDPPSSSSSSDGGGGGGGGGGAGPPP